MATRRGFFAQVAFVDHISRREQRFGFQRLYVQSQQYVPFRHGHQVLASGEIRGTSVSIPSVSAGAPAAGPRFLVGEIRTPDLGTTRVYLRDGDVVGVERE